jgi:hypothetical protein
MYMCVHVYQSDFDLQRNTSSSQAVSAVEHIKDMALMLWTCISIKWLSPTLCFESKFHAYDDTEYEHLRDPYQWQMESICEKQ